MTAPADVLPAGERDGNAVAVAEAEAGETAAEGDVLLSLLLLQASNSARQTSATAAIR